MNFSDQKLFRRMRALCIECQIFSICGKHFPGVKCPLDVTHSENDSFSAWFVCVGVGERGWRPVLFGGRQLGSDPVPGAPSPPLLLLF